MSKAKFFCPTRKVDVVSPISVPNRNYTKLIRGWYTAAQKRIPEIPEIPEQEGRHYSNLEERDWALQDHFTESNYIVFQLIKQSTLERAVLTIRRDSL